MRDSCHRNRCRIRIASPEVQHPSARSVQRLSTQAGRARRRRSRGICGPSGAAAADPRAPPAYRQASNHRCCRRGPDRTNVDGSDDRSGCTGTWDRRSARELPVGCDTGLASITRSRDLVQGSDGCLRCWALTVTVVPRPDRTLGTELRYR